MMTIKGTINWTGASYSWGDGSNLMGREGKTITNALYFSIN